MSCFRGGNRKLISRYKESRRAHPLNENGQMSLMDSILEEKQLLSNIRTIANYIVDTTQLTTKELKARVKEKFEDENFKSFSINVSSFGFKHGIQKSRFSI